MPLKDADWHWDQMRGRSDALFGSPHRLRVALLVSVADDEELYAARIAEAAEIDRREAGRQFADLERAELLVRVSNPPCPKKRGQPARLMARKDEEAWAALQVLGERFRRRPPPGRSANQEV